MGLVGIGTESLDGDSMNEDWKMSNTHKLIGELGGCYFDACLCRRSSTKL